MGTFRHVLEGPRPVKKSRLTVSVPWRVTLPPKPDNSVLEIFGEMEFRERNFGIGTPCPSPSPASIPITLLYSPDISQFEIEEIQELGEPAPEKIDACGRRTCLRCNSDVGSRVSRAEFPPPISSIGRNGKPWVYYQQIKKDGRFVLKEIRMPSQGCMHATREDGRLLLQFSNPDNADG